MPGNERIAMIGNGNVGTNLGRGLQNGGYEVRSVGKEPEKVKEVAAWADTIILAVPFGERENVLREMGNAAEGKVVVDVTNALTPEYEFALDTRKSGAEQIQEKAPRAKVVKAFNTVFAQNMATGGLKEEPLTAFIAADDEEAKRRVIEMAGAIGFDPIDAGPLKNARYLETLGFLNISLGYQLNMGTDIGFKLIHPTKGAARKEAGKTAQRR